jgi:hypothetical protein
VHLSVACCASVVALSMVACDPDFTLRGTVKSGSGAPLQAVVRVVCGGSAFAEAVTKPDGSFVVHRTGWCPASCTIEIHPHGAPVERFPVMQYCASEPRHLRGKACLDVAVDARMGRQRSAAPGEAMSPAAGWSRPHDPRVGTGGIGCSSSRVTVR